MVNPFDRNFFKFSIGFVMILCFSFTVLYFTGKYSSVIDQKEVEANIKNI